MFLLPAAKGRNAANSFYKSSKPAEKKQEYRAGAQIYTAKMILLKYNPVSRISILGFLNPVMGVLLSALFLGENKEAFSVNGLLALLLVSAGIIIVNIVPEHRKTAVS